jgi:hypothetical protein
MTVTAKYPIQVGDKDHDTVDLQPGDDVPSWAEEYLKPEVVVEGHPEAAGSDLYSDQIYDAVCMAAKAVGLEDSDIEGLSSEQIAALVRSVNKDQEMVEEFGEDALDEEDADPGNVDPMVKLFGTQNADGNVNAPDQAEKKSRSKSTGSSGSTGSQGGSTGGSDT